MEVDHRNSTNNHASQNKINKNVCLVIPTEKVKNKQRFLVYSEPLKDEYVSRGGTTYLGPI